MSSNSFWSSESIHFGSYVEANKKLIEANSVVLNVNREQSIGSLYGKQQGNSLFRSLVSRTVSQLAIFFFFCFSVIKKTLVLVAIEKSDLLSVEFHDETFIQIRKRIN